MKTAKTILLICIALCFVTSCKKEVDMTLAQKTVLENTDIRQIEVSDSWHVTVIADSNTFVELEYSAYLEPYLKTKMGSSKLELGFTGNVHAAINSVYRATVHTNKIEKIKAEETAKVNFIGHFSATSDMLLVELTDASVCSGLDYSGHNCDISIEEASQFFDFQLAGYNCEVKVSDASVCKGNFDMSFHLVAELNGASRFITLGGATPYGMIKLQDASLLNMVQTQIRELHVDLSGASEATVQVSDAIEGTLKETSTLYYQGHPQLDIDCSDDSQIIPF